MSYQINLKEIEKRAHHAVFQDGVMEILMGFVLIFFGGAINSPGTMAPFIVFAIFFASPILERVKKRFIYPRSGYVKLPEKDAGTAKGIGIATLVFVLVLVAVLVVSLLSLGVEADRDFFMTWILPPCTGLMLAFGRVDQGQLLKHPGNIPLTLEGLIRPLLGQIEVTQVEGRIGQHPALQCVVRHIGREQHQSPAVLRE